ncbi:MAG: ribonuclease H-like domain-containing protein [Methanoregula sp.]|nr:ribonuclease H-like domain-containing protein [Methanoregula sp.]
MSAVPAPSRVGSLWQQRMQSLREYEVVRDGNAFGAGFSNSFVYSSEYENARRHLETLISRYQGITIGEQFRGREIVNDGGTCFSLESRQDLSNPAFDLDRFRMDLLDDLTLVHGIGPATRKKLNARGFQTIPDLLEHPALRSRARRVPACLSEGNTASIMDMIGSRHAKSHMSVLGVAGLHEPEDYVFVDIETLGLFSRPIILFGIGVIDNGQLVVRQYLLRDIAEEQAALIATVGHLSRDRPALVTFNGKSFDLPYITDRLAYYGMAAPARIPHFDVLHFSRRRWKDQFPSLRLAALEQEILGICRNDDIPGQMVPEFYETYLRTGNIGPLVPIVEHNRQDVISLALLFFHLLGESYGCH